MDIDIKMHEPDHLFRASNFVAALRRLEAAHRVNVYAAEYGTDGLRLEFIDDKHEPYGPYFVIGDQAEDGFERKLGIDESVGECPQRCEGP